ncbi:hypothetical protein FHS23_001596 [Prauserella isguenensis]|uniref:Preprotein translocase subunit SecG n=2 Tax=Prauserella isguenensis TaxID=1470180 RepID=A0A839RXV1_9PSEU|nr:hypothetical protein [Prauserella isguenensis]
MLPAAMTGPAMAATEVLAQQQDTGGQGQDFGKSSPVGLLLMLVFLIAVVFLVRSMTKHLKRVPASFDDSGSGSGEDSSGTGDGDGDGDAASGAETVSASPGEQAKRDES